MLDNLLIFSSEGYNQKVLKPIKKLKQFLEKGIIRGLGDYLEPPSKRDIEKIKPLYDELCQNKKEKDCLKIMEREIEKIAFFITKWTQ